jgi:hypothetical protein
VLSVKLLTVSKLSSQATRSTLKSHLRELTFYALPVHLGGNPGLANVNLHRSPVMRFKHGGVLYHMANHYSQITPVCTQNSTTRLTFGIEEGNRVLNAVFDTKFFFN